MKLITRKINSLTRNSVRAGVLAVLMIGTAGYASETQLDSPNQNTRELFHYVSYPGSAFIPFASKAVFGYKGAGCIYNGGGTEKRFSHKVLLPEGAVIKYVRMYSYDDSASNVRGFLTTYDATGNFTEHTYFDSVNGGYGSVLSPEMNYIVNHFTNPINVVANLGEAELGDADIIFKNGFEIDDLIFRNGFESDGPDLAFCGVRIAYTMP